MTTSSTQPKTTYYDNLKQLMRETGFPLYQCRQALDKAEGNLEESKRILKTELGNFISTESRNLKEFVIGSYLHHDRKVGVLVKLCAETDFCTRTDEFINLANTIAMLIAGFKPGSIKELLEVPTDETGMTVGQKIDELSRKTKEQIKIDSWFGF